MSKYKVSICKTKNKFIVKFEINEFITNHQNYEFNNIDEATNSPLAKELFYYPFVKKIYVTSNFIAIERFNVVQWEDVQDEVAKKIENYLNQGNTIISENSSDKKIPISIYSESTPNPAALKFVANKKLVDFQIEFNSIDECENSPLALRLFNFPFVKSVFIDKNFISITKYDTSSWDDITLTIRNFIKEYLERDNKILTDDYQKVEVIDPDSLDETSKEIVSILDEYIKPSVAADGGNIMFKSYDKANKSVSVILQGACSGCPSSTITLKNGIENILKKMLNGKVEVVEAINE
ncbi:MAG: NifU family protein [Flavobacteriaceae bacterium]|jgi:NFU1 iron-sulfur cluster scaffold homolog, mitochondrial|nr:NifU family protein [Flavobacteriaceae bacterium]